MPARFPERIVCLTEETTETLYLLGEGDRVVGVSGYTVRPPEARKKPRVSSFLDANFERILELKLNGAPIRDEAIYRVTMNSFLATGGDNFTIFNQGTDSLGGDQDVDALEAYIAANSPLAPPATNRIANLTP